MSEKPGQVFRFGLGYRLAHWNNAVFFLLLLVTGLMFVFHGLTNLLGATGIVWVNRVHRWAAYPYTFLTVPFLLLGARAETREWLRTIFTFDKDDLAFLQKFPQALFVRNAKLPPQGKFNAGEKVNSILTIAGTSVMILTGWTMALSRNAAVMAWALPVHSVTAMLLGALILGHMWLGLVHPEDKAALPGMWRGYIDAAFARHHYGKWYRARNRAKG